MPDQVQLRGGTEGENDTFTGVAREVTVDTTNKTLRVHDGSTSGGSKLAAFDEWGRLQVADPVGASDVVNKSFMDTAIGDSRVVRQMIVATHSTEVSTTSITFVATGLSATITPSSSLSKILVIHSGVGGRAGTDANNSVFFTIFRGDLSGVNLGAGDHGLLHVYVDGSSTFRLFGSLGMTVKDEPATTDPRTYTVAMRANSGQSATAQRNSTPSTLILMEVAP